MEDGLNLNRLAEMLTKREFRYFDQITSTNDEAQQWALVGAPDGALVIADEQIAGRGRLQRSWQTPPGQALAISMILRPPIEMAQRIVMVGAVAVIEALAAYIPSEQLMLKWPNDVLLNGKKICGVLTEALWVGEKLEAVILGMGINIRVNFSGTELTGAATSLEDHMEGVVDRLMVLKKVVDRVDYWSDHIHEVLTTWRKWLGTIGQSVSIQTKEGIVQGLAYDVDESGALLVTDSNGQLQRIVVGDVR